MASGSVRVWPCTLPANMIVAPNSPRPRANASEEPTARPGAASGRATRRNVRNGLAPRVRAAARRSGSTEAKAAGAPKGGGGPAEPPFPPDRGEQPTPRHGGRQDERQVDRAHEQVAPA